MAKTLKPGAAYYVGAYRFVKNGEPIRVASWVKDLSPNARAMMGKGSDAKPNSPEVQAQRHPQTTYLPPD